MRVPGHKRHYERGEDLRLPLFRVLPCLSTLIEQF